MSKRRKKSFLRRSYKSILFVLLVCAIVFYYIKEMDHREAVEHQELFVNDSPYHKLENSDSTYFIANVVLNENRSILQVAKDYYNKDIYWVYIFNSNPDMGDILDLKQGSIIKIPKVSPILLDTSNLESLKLVKDLGDSIMNDIEQKRLKALKQQNSTDW